MLLTTQYLEEADRLADGIVVVARGRVVARGTPLELKDALGARVDVVLEDEADLAATATLLSGHSGSAPVLDVPGRRLSLAVPAGALTLPELVRVLDAAGIRAQDAGVRRPTLDEVFLDLIGDKSEVAA